MTKHRFSIVRVLLVAVLLCVLAGGAPPAAVAQEAEGDLASRLDKFLAKANAHLGFNGTVLVGLGDEPLFVTGVGDAVREWNVPNDADTVYFTAPIMNQIIAVAILKLVDAGEITLDDPICDHLSNCPEEWEDVTISHLLTHTSGIGNEQASSNPTLPLAFAPGEGFLWSGYGYELLGKIITAKSGKGYQTYLKETFFIPLGMESTSTGLYMRIVPHRAEGYASAVVRAPAIIQKDNPGTGALASTVGDLFLWTRALHNGELVEEATINDMLDRAWELEDFPGAYYAGGVVRYEEGGVPIWRSSGELPGFRTNLYYAPEQDATIIVLSNQPGEVVSSVADQILAMVAAEDAP